MLLIIDEVQTGIGRTGSLFAFQQYDIKPDVVTMAKGLGGGMPIGAVMAADTCCNVLTPGTHATTFGGTPIVCSAANVVLDTVGDGQFLMKVREKGEYLRNGILSPWLAEYQGRARHGSHARHHRRGRKALRVCQ